MESRRGVVRRAGYPECNPRTGTASPPPGSTPQRCPAMRGPIIQEIPRQYPGKPQELFMFYPTVSPTFFRRDGEVTAWALTWSFENARRTGTLTCSRVEAGRITHSGNARIRESTMAEYTYPDLLVSTAWVAEHLHDPQVRIVESDEDILL